MLQTKVIDGIEYKCSPIVKSMCGKRARTVFKMGCAYNIEAVEAKGKPFGEPLQEGTNITFIPFGSRFPPFGFLPKDIGEISIEEYSQLFNNNINK